MEKQVFLFLHNFMLRELGLTLKIFMGSQPCKSSPMPMDEKCSLVPSEKNSSFTRGRKMREINYVCCEINHVRLKFLQLKSTSQPS